MLVVAQVGGLTCRRFHHHYSMATAAPFFLWLLFPLIQLKWCMEELLLVGVAVYVNNLIISYLRGPTSRNIRYERHLA